MKNCAYTFQIFITLLQQFSLLTPPSGGLVAMSLPLNPLKGTYKEFTLDVYNKKTDN